MTQTTYYEFNKPEGTDLVNPLVDTNPNWDIADSALHELNERSVANATEIVSLGVHAISRLNTDTKFIKWIATANFTAGDTFTVDGLTVQASTPSGASLETNAYVAGSVVLAALNADNSAMTIFVSGTTVAADSERLGGELPSYYATQSDMTTAETDIENLQNQAGNSSIVGIADGTLTGAIVDFNSKLTLEKYDTSSDVYTSAGFNSSCRIRKYGKVITAFVYFEPTGSVTSNTLIGTLKTGFIPPFNYLTVPILNQGSGSFAGHLYVGTNGQVKAASNISAGSYLAVFTYTLAD